MASGLPGGGPDVAPELCDHAVAGVLGDEDVERGGFGGAPKFPPSALLEALLRNYERTGEPAPLAAVERTATAMARGGIYDQLAGGFARYSMDSSWVVPHFGRCSTTTHCCCAPTPIGHAAPETRWRAESHPRPHAS